jgi:uncharacterized protein YkwD
MTRLRLALAAITAALTILAPAAADARSAAKQLGVHKPRVIVAMSAADCVGSDLVPTVDNLATIRSATLCLLNVERTTRGRVALRTNGALDQAAGLYARSMIDYGFFDHVSPNGSTFVGRIKRTDYLARTNGWALGENLAWGQVQLGSPEQIVDAWMHSPEHKRNILDGRYTEIGVGVSYGTPGGGHEDAGATYATEFGTRSLVLNG